MAHHVRSYLIKNRLPSFETNCIEDWELKVDEIVNETVDERMSLISGIPPGYKCILKNLKNIPEDTSKIFFLILICLYMGV